MAKQFTVKIDCDNAAFEDRDSATEVATILRRLADRIYRDGFSGFYETILDSNGNDVGRYALKDSQE